MDLDLAGRTYIVTGGSKGLGYATAEALVAEGANVVISSRNANDVNGAGSRLGPNVLAMAVDSQATDTADRLLDMAARRFGGIDGILISIGGPPKGSAMSTADELWRAAFETIFLGSVRIARTVAAQLPAGGAVGFVLSSSVKQPIPDLAISNGLRPGLAMIAKTLADELGPRGVRVFGLAPGRIATERTAVVDAGDPTSRARSEAAIPLRRLGKPEEFGRVAAFMLSPAASYMSGCIVSVDGGMSRSI